ncbi:MAG: GFA family protein [Gammaproteobacteria bacterium]|nr:GFA family protein [Gammaproteobacteria bacterium]
MILTELTGSCLCGSVKYRVNTVVHKFYFCHCEQCRKITGSAFASNILTEPSEINWLSGSKKIKRFDYPGEKSYTKVFCSECGSGLPFLNERGTTLIVPAGSLDGDCGLIPDNNIFWSDKAAWYEEGISAEKCDEFPA